MDTISFYTSPQSIEMSNIMKRSHSFKVMDYPVVKTYHFNFVWCLCCNMMTWWPFGGVGHCSKNGYGYNLIIYYSPPVNWDVQPDGMVSSFFSYGISSSRNLSFFLCSNHYMALAIVPIMRYGYYLSLYPSPLNWGCST